MEERSVLSGLSESWMASLLLNLLCYSTVFVPGYFLIQYFKRSKYLERAGNGLVGRLITSCVYGQSYDHLPTAASSSDVSSPPRTPAADRTFMAKGFQLGSCFLGLQVSYLTWGVLQEKIMTKEYHNTEGSIGHFKDSQFLVFINRILAFLLSAGYLLVSRQPRHTAPIYKYSYSSFSNIMSSWCQYEALKYVTFPTQVLAKASKIIPTMIMGKIVRSKKYDYYEYVTAVLISFGMTLFLLGSTEAKSSSSSNTTLSGVVILVGYMAFDAFTSNWQGELFSQHKMSSVQMMCGVNLFSCLLTSASLLQQSGFGPSVAFMFTYPTFFWDSFILSVCSATGQLFIYYTISVFGPVVFIIIMTIRQGLAILLSCLIYGHPVSVLGIMGILLVFTAMFLRVYCSYRIKASQARRISTQPGPDTTKV